MALLLELTSVLTPLTPTVGRLLLPKAVRLLSTILSLPGVPVTWIVMSAPLKVLVKQTPSFAHFLVAALDALGITRSAVRAAMTASRLNRIVVTPWSWLTVKTPCPPRASAARGPAAEVGGRPPTRVRLRAAMNAATIARLNDHAHLHRDRLARPLRQRRARPLRLGGALGGGARVRQRPRAARRHA